MTSLIIYALIFLRESEGTDIIREGLLFLM
jgi:hypothetical protein